MRTCNNRIYPIRPNNITFLIIIFLLATSIFAQQEVSKLPDADSIKTTEVISTASDSSIPDSVLTDTTKTEGDLDTLVNYAAEKVDFTFSPRVTILTGKASVSYKTMELSAHKIEVHWEDDLLFAEGLLDTVELDSSEGGGDTLVWKDLPRMVDGSEIIDGHKMVYHLKSRKGTVTEGATEYDEGFCHGKTIKKVDKNTLNIRSGYYTTCDLEDPHYCFWGRDLKLIVKDRVIARPVVLYFGPVPVMIIPYAFFPARGGRHSGLIIPTYGESSSQGRFLKNLGYYWAPSDYFDIRTMLNFYEKFGIELSSYGQYKKRYVFNGNVNGSLVRKHYSDHTENRWSVNLTHSHTLSPSARLNVRGNYQSDASLRKDISNNPYERMKREMQSNATLSKSWPGTPYSGSINIKHHEVLNTGQVTQMLPQITFSRQNQPIFPQIEDADADDAKWYNLLYFSYRANGQQKRTVQADKVTRWEVTSPTDSSEVTEYSKNPWRYKSGVRQSLSFTASQKPLGYFSLTQRINYTEDWFDEWLEWQQHEDWSVDSVEIDGFKARRTFNMSVQLGTTLYGLFHPRLFGIEALRHKLDPSISFSYAPDFSEPHWGNYYTFHDSTGQIEIKKDKFKGVIYGGTSQTERMSLGISIGNLFQYKRIKEEQEIKGDLFDLKLSTSHNFAADSLKWSQLSSMLGFKPKIGGESKSGLARMISRVSLNLRGRHSFYALKEDPDFGTLREISEPAPNLLRLVDFSLGCSFSLKSIKKHADRDTSRTKYTPEYAFISDSIEVEKEIEPEWKPAPIPWDASVSFRYSENHTNPDRISKNITTSLKLSVQVTENWKVNYNTNFDLDRKRVTLSGFTIYRDMHCWEGSLNWTPVGSGKGYYLRIGIKSAQLRDVKVEKRKGRTGIGGY
ncbi:MAG: putative LPS assembly protein LptD [Candidatus Hatepunaea meridiana]|nr:putative LPS assembly protein LptD [Candidatus Hatepunaea meridiana]